MTKSPKYPIAGHTESEALDVKFKGANGETPADLYVGPSFKLRSEIRPPLESSRAAYLRAYPQFTPRRRSTRQGRRAAIRSGNY
jgi:hypothetical protein